jgi:uncharacterized membrane protein
MTVAKIIILYLLTVPVFFAIDMTWLGVIAKNLYRTQIGQLLRADIVWWTAILFYALFILGIVYFAVLPAVAAGAWTKALVLGAAFGFFTYMTYDLTNLATLSGWSTTIAIVDMIWGTVLSASVAALSYLIAMRFLV